MKAVEMQNEQCDIIKIFPDDVEYYKSIGWKVVGSESEKAEEPVVENEAEEESE